MIWAQELLRQGGEFMGEAHSWLQRKKLNGSTVTWGSQDVLQPPMTVSDVEEVAAYAAAAERNRCIRTVEGFLDIPTDIRELLLKRLSKA